MRLDFLLVVSVIVFIFWQSMEKTIEIQESKKEPIVQKALPMDTSFEETMARTSLNEIREAMGMNSLIFNPHLEQSAQAHADYLVKNGESSHYQSEKKSKFTGTKPVDRAMRAGYSSRNMSENISTQTKNAQKSLDGLFSAIYHRFGFLSTTIDELGIGVTQNPDNPQESAFVYVMGNSEMARVCNEASYQGASKYFYKVCKDLKHRILEKDFISAKTYNQRNNPPITLYPYENQSEVPPAFYVETPDPLPEYDVSGFPVSISFNPYYFKKVKLLSFRLYNSEDIPIEEVLLMDEESDPHGRFLATEFALFPLERLDYESQYKAEVVYVHKGQEETISWYFFTEIPKDSLRIITLKEESISLFMEQSYTIYFKPLDATDLLESIRFPANVSIERLDNNTLKITLPKDKRDFDIVSGDRILHVDVF